LERVKQGKQNYEIIKKHYTLPFYLKLLANIRHARSMASMYDLLEGGSSIQHNWPMLYKKHANNT
jgi:hypothetical protein